MKVQDTMQQGWLAIQYGQNFMFVSDMVDVTLSGTALFTLVASLTASNRGSSG